MLRLQSTGSSGTDAVCCCCLLHCRLFVALGVAAEEKSAMKKHESKFVTFDPQAMYTIDRINNGLYR